MCCINSLIDFVIQLDLSLSFFSPSLVVVWVVAFCFCAPDVFVDIPLCMMVCDSVYVCLVIVCAHLSPERHGRRSYGYGCRMEVYVMISSMDFHSASIRQCEG